MLLGPVLVVECYLGWGRGWMVHWVCHGCQTVCDPSSVSPVSWQLLDCSCTPSFPWAHYTSNYQPGVPIIDHPYKRLYQLLTDFETYVHNLALQRSSILGLHWIEGKCVLNPRSYVSKGKWYVLCTTKRMCETWPFLLLCPFTQLRRHVDKCLPYL